MAFPDSKKYVGPGEVTAETHALEIFHRNYAH